MGDDAGALDAGDFGSWLTSVTDALAGDGGSDVPCGTCTACCTSSQFVHIAPDEADALAHIPRQLLFAAPGRPRGHVLMGYDERGQCPMLRDGACSIYAHRPRTCRTYDCRVFAASGIEPSEPAKAAVAAQVRRWRFRVANDEDRARRDAVRAAAAYVRDRPEVLPDGAGPLTDTQRAVLAVELGDLFARVAGGRSGAAALPGPDEVRVEIARVVRR